MEIKCKICGTINDGETNFCKGCFVKLDNDKPIENNYNPKEKEIVVPIEEEKEIVVPWADEDELKPMNNLEKNLDNQNIEFNEWVQPELKPIGELESMSQLTPFEEVKPEVPVEETVPEITPFEEVESELPVEETVPEITSFEEVKAELPVEETVPELTPFEEVKPEVPVEETVPEITPFEEAKTEVPAEEVVPEITSFEEVKTEVPVEEIVPEVTSIEEVKTEAPVEETVPEITPFEEVKSELPVEEIVPELTPFEEVNAEVPVENNIQESIPEMISNEVVSTIGEDNNNQVVENSIPELSEFDNWNNDQLPQLDMNQFEIKDQKDDKWDVVVEDNESLESKYKYVGVGKLFGKYLLSCLIIGILFGATCIGFRYLMTHIFNMGIRGELIFIVVSSVASVATLLLATDITFKKTIPLVNKLNATTFMILFLIALPYTLIKLAYNLYIGSTVVIMLILVALSLIILAIFFNYIRNNIRKKHDIKTDDKISFIYGILSIILVAATLFGVYTYKDKDSDISFDILFNDTKNKETVMQYIYQVEKTILINQTGKEGYEIPNPLSDVNYASVEGSMPEEMTLYINDNGGVTSGTVVYKGITYTYNGQTIEAEK